jgi:broad specificity phosphatase PhoE
MKRIYLVRHAETDGNTGTIQQDPETSLNAVGRRQTVTLTGRCSRIQFDRIVCSTLPRAKETATPIIELSRKPVVFSDLFVEFQRPTLTMGKPKDHPNSVAFNRFVLENFGKPNKRFADEENFEDMKDRALKALDFLTETPGHDLVIGHGFFARGMLACAVFGPDLTGDVCNAFCRVFRTRNTGITILDYEPGREFPWRVHTWNDHAHLTVTLSKCSGM